jgi:hypothetical protein
VPAGLWQDVVSRLADAINDDDDPSIPIPLAVLSMTSAALLRLLRVEP